MENPLRRQSRKGKGKAKSAEVAAATKKFIESLKSSVKEQMKLLGMLAPNGKSLGMCTMQECRQFGGWYLKLAKGKRDTDLVAKHYNEAQLRSMQNWKEDA